uniref:LysM domain-containing protein n=1 Tax=Araucaria cunninghamii TaxID=56994 RepID=A0A0D6R722_ARACU
MGIPPCICVGVFTIMVFFNGFVGVLSKSTIEPCDGSDTCNSMVGYTLATDLKISEVASRFQVDPVALLGANGIDVSSPDVENQILPARYFFRVPVTCSCMGGIRKVSNVVYKVRAADTLSSIAASVFGGLVTSEQVRVANSISDPQLIDIGQGLTIPLPCSCFNGTDNGSPAIYLSYVVHPGDTLAGLGAKYGTTVTDLMTVNALGTPAIKGGDIIAIPLSACSSTFSKYASDAGMLVANGSYTITASHCVQCSCGPADLNLYCAPAPLAASCSSMQCKNSILMVGNTTTQPTPGGCNVTTCSYNGFLNGTILTSLYNALQPRCPGVHVMPNFTRPSSTMISIAPSPGVASSPKSPSHVTSSPIIGGFAPANGPTGSSSSAPELLRWVSITSFLVLGLSFVIHFGDLQFLH